MKQQCESHAIDALALGRGTDVVTAALAWATPRLGGKPLLIYSTAAPDEVQEVQQALGREEAGTLVEQALGRIASGLVGCGVRRLVVAGGETSGAVVDRLGIPGFLVGAEIAAGVPVLRAVGARESETQGAMLLALKSGNFGGPEFFSDALKLMR